jgi:hypothetical protein
LCQRTDVNRTPLGLRDQWGWFLVGRRHLGEDSGGNSILSVDLDGTAGGYGWTQILTIEGVTGLTDEAALVTAGNLIAS